MAKRKPTPRRATETAAPTAPAPADPATLEPTQVEPAPIERSVTPPVPTEARAALLLALCSAVAAGGHEIAWSRLLGRAVGHTSLGVGLALAAFMAGSGAGALLAARAPIAWRTRRGLALAEALVGIGSLLVLACTSYLPAPSALLGIEGQGGLALDVCAASLVALVPSIAMGATLPLLVAAAPRARIAALYAAGLAGAVAGVLGAAVLVAPRLGHDGLLVVASVIDLLVAFAALRLPDLERAPSARAERVPLDVPAVLRFASVGALGIGAQAVWGRALVPYAGVSSFALAGIVATYVGAQALGFRVLARVPPVERERWGTLASLLAAPLALGALGVVPSVAVEGMVRDVDPLGWALRSLAAIALVVGPVALALGLAQASSIARADEAGGGLARAAAITGWGTLASALGALLAPLVLLPSLGPRGALAVLALGPIAASLRDAAARSVAAASALLVAALLFVAPGPAWFLGPSLDRAPLVHAAHDLEGTTAIVLVDQPTEPAIRRVVSNGVSYSGDSIFAQRYMRLLAHLPALATRGRERALLVCVGTGTTLDALRIHGFAAIDAVDTSPSIRRTLGYFAHATGDVARDPRVRFVEDDGARWLRATRERYDVITLEPPPPRAPGGSSLYARELYEAARARLREGGTVAQWLPLHGLSDVEASAIVRTFAEVFPGATLHLAERNEAILLGARDDVARRASEVEPAVRADLARIGLGGALDPLTDTLWVDDVAGLVAGAPVLRDAWPLPEHAPFGDAASAPLDALLERAQQRGSASPGSSAALLGPAVAGFVRIEEGREQPGDRARLVAAMRAWLARDPGDPYVQHAFGFGRLLEERLDRLQGSLDPHRVAELRAAMQARRASAGVDP